MYTIRELTKAQQPLDYLISVFEMVKKFNWTWESFCASLSDVYHRVWVLEEESKPIAVCGGQVIFEQVSILYLYVLEAYRGRGVGNYLLTEIFKQLASQSLYEVLLEVREANVPARSLYKGLGFVEIGRRLAYYTSPKEDAIVLQKKLRKE